MAGRGWSGSHSGAARPPTIGEPVRVALPGHDTGLRSHVHAIADDELVIAAPVEPPGMSPVPLGGQLSLSWTNDRGLHRLTVQLRERLTDSQRWRVALVAPPRREQRRTGYRVPVVSDVQVGIDGFWHRGHLVDLSESGLRCLLTPDEAVAEGSPCRVRLGLVRPGLQVDGEVVRVREGIDAMTDLGVRFLDVPVGVAEDLCRYLLNAQLELQRLDGLPET